MKIDEAISLIKNTAFLGYNGDDDKMAEAIQTIEQLVGKIEQLKKERDAAVAEWISVKDRLPEVGQKVLACGVRHGMEVQQFHKARFYNDGSCWWDWKHNSAKSVTHWMSLPEPPEVEE